MVTVRSGSAPTRRLDIEAALRWAYREELPKTGALNRDEIDAPRHPGFVRRDRSELTTTVQMLVEMPTNCFGVLQQIGAGGPPHPDALLIGDAVLALDRMTMDVPPDWKPMAEMDDLSPEVTRLLNTAVFRVAREINGDRHLFGMRPSFLVQRYALSGLAPRWQAETPTVRFASHSNGVPRWFVRRLVWSDTTDGRQVSHEVELDGFDAKARRPYDDAYRKTLLDPDPEPAIRARAEYELWHAALDALADDLAPLLTTITLSPSPRPARPWIEGESAPSVLPDLSDMRWP